MGRPLFIAPVESDIPPKATAKSPGRPGQTQSPIRRSHTQRPGNRVAPTERGSERADRRRRFIHESREHRLRLATLQDENADRHEAAQRLLDGILADGDERRSRSYQHVWAPDDDLSQILSNRTTDEPRDSPPTAIGDHLHANWPARLFPIPVITARHRSSSSQASPALRVSPGLPPVPSILDMDNEIRRRRSSRPDARARHRESILSARRSGNRVRYADGLDGLGDRHRSLSPEGDGVWDTLQSTVTPDPQPPSVGSSFASTTASAAASQSNTADASATTSVTTPDEEMEPPCDPVDSDGEDMAIWPPRDGLRVRTTQPESRRRSYADVVADGGGSPEWLEGMHRIVRGLAAREDIPDDWWAEAGLSRSMRYEDSI